MITATTETIDTEFYLPLHGDGRKLGALACDLAFMVALQGSFEAHNLVAGDSIVTLDAAVLSGPDRMGGLAVGPHGPGSGRKGMQLLFMTGRRTRRDGDEDDYFDHLDASRYVSACHSAIAPSRSRALDSWRRHVKGLLSASNANHRFLAPGTRQTALRDGTILRVRHDLDQERRHRKIRLTQDAKILLEAHEGYMMFYLVDGSIEVGPVPVTAAETGVGCDEFVRTIEAAAGEPLLRRHPARTERVS